MTRARPGEQRAAVPACRPADVSRYAPDHGVRAAARSPQIHTNPLAAVRSEGTEANFEPETEPIFLVSGDQLHALKIEVDIYSAGVRSAGALRLITPHVAREVAVSSPGFITGTRSPAGSSACAGSGAPGARQGALPFRQLCRARVLSPTNQGDFR